MTPSQRRALKNVCFDARETMHPRFAEIHPLNLYSTILTLNVGME